VTSTLSIMHSGMLAEVAEVAEIGAGRNLGIKPELSLLDLQTEKRLCAGDDLVERGLIDTVGGCH